MSRFRTADTEKKYRNAARCLTVEMLFTHAAQYLLVLWLPVHGSIQWPDRAIDFIVEIPDGQTVATASGAGRRGGPLPALGFVEIDPTRLADAAQADRMSCQEFSAPRALPSCLSRKAPSSLPVKLGKTAPKSKAALS